MVTVWLIKKMIKKMTVTLLSIKMVKLNTMKYNKVADAV